VPDAQRLVKAVMLIPQLRSFHVEFKMAASESVVLYMGNKEDFDPELISGQEGRFRRFGLREFLGLMRSPPDVFEIVEPLYVRAWPLSALCGYVLKLSARCRRQEVRVVAYAIENLPLAALLDVKRLSQRVPSGPANWILRKCWQRSSRLLDRVAYGTEAARQNYASAGLSQQAVSRLFWQLPSPCSCSVERPGPGPAVKLLFLGEFTERKGVADVLAAWPKVLAEVPQAKLTLVGHGEQLPDVEQFTRLNEARLLLGATRREVHEELSRAEVVVLPSKRIANWREQVGLPIVEALAHGCRVVTTSETGLASWLEEHGHQVVAPGDAAGLAQALIRALQSGPSAADIRQDLPTLPGRVESQEWMYADVAVSS
jgi:glycosyltransferase involved in cell wall biosynthesis